MLLVRKNLPFQPHSKTHKKKKNDVIVVVYLFSFWFLKYLKAYVFENFISVTNHDSFWTQVKNFSYYFSLQFKTKQKKKCTFRLNYFFCTLSYRALFVLKNLLVTCLFKLKSQYHAFQWSGQILIPDIFLPLVVATNIHPIFF